MPKAPIGAAWLPPPWAPADAAAMQALAAGRADSEQQIRALRWIVEKASGTYEMSYRPNSARDSDFAEGRRFVGNQIVKLTKLNLARLRKTDAGEPREQD
jgi:hypothetical protein